MSADPEKAEEKSKAKRRAGKKKRTPTAPKKRKRASKKGKGAGPKSSKRARRPYPRAPLEKAIGIARVIREKNGGNPWATDDVAKAVGLAKANNDFFYMVASAREFGLTEGSRDTSTISLTQLGRDLVYAASEEQEEKKKRDAFFNVEVFKRVYDHYQGTTLPEMQYLGNTLEREFKLEPDVHEEFAALFKQNCDYLNLADAVERRDPRRQDIADGVLTLAEPESGSGFTCFVIMPFSEKMEGRPKGYFREVLNSLIVPAGREAGFVVNTADRRGSDIIHATIVRNLLEADLVVADLTDHNPNVLFELGVRMAADKPVALLRAHGTPPIFDVDNLLRVWEYDPNLWNSTVEHDLPRLVEHIAGAWQQRDSVDTYMKILTKNASS